MLRRCSKKTALAAMMVLGITAAGLQASNERSAETAYTGVPGGGTVSPTDRETNPKLQSLLKRLQDSEVYERQRAAIELGNLGDRQAVPPLLEALKDEDTFVRNFAAKALGKLKDARAVDGLILAMEDGNLLVRRSAAESLGLLGEAKPVEALLKAMQSGNDLLQRAAIEALGSIGDSRAVGPLIEALRGADVFIRNGVADALTDIGQPAIPRLVEALHDWTLGPRIIEILSALGWQPTSDEERVWLYVASRNRRFLLDNWSSTQKVLIESMESGDSKQLQNAVAALIGIGRNESLVALVGIIEKRGTAIIAKAYMDSGNDTLIEAARDWAARSGAEIGLESGTPVVEWGSMEDS